MPLRIYNVVGVATIALQILMGAVLAPPWIGPVGGAVFAFAYLVLIWFLGGLYLSDVIHLGIAHRALDYKAWFIKLVSVVYNVVGIYINPRTWVNRHRHHHTFSDAPGDPNKLAEDGFWRTMYLCVIPYRCDSDLARDAIFWSWSLRLVSNPVFAVLSQFISFGLLFLVVRDLAYAVALWVGVRVFALWINMIQNYWAHDRRWGFRRYPQDRDNAMNLGDWLPVTASFSASLQNNHHHSSGLARLSHEPGEYDFGFLTVRVMRALGLVEGTTLGLQIPKDAPLQEVGL